MEPVHRDPTLRLAARQDLGAPRLGGGQDVALRRLLGTMSDLLTVQDIDRVARTVAVERILRGGGPLEQAPAEAEADARPLLANLRHLIDGDHLAAARVLLDATPLSVLNDPLVMKLRAVLAPPVVTRLQRHDVDRHREYEWLRTEGPRHRGRWVALEGNTVVASAPTLRKLRDQLRSRRTERPPLIHRID